MESQPLHFPLMLACILIPDDIELFVFSDGKKVGSQRKSKEVSSTAEEATDLSTTHHSPELILNSSVCVSFSKKIGAVGDDI